MSNSNRVLVALLILVTWPHHLSAVEYEASIAVEPGDIIDGWRVIDIDTDDAPPVINDRGQIGYFAFVQSLEDPTRFRDVLFSGDRVVIEGRTFLGGLFIDDWDEDSTYLAINNLGMVAHADADDLDYIGVERTLLAHGDPETALGSPGGFMPGRAVDDTGRVAYNALLEEYTAGADTRMGLFLGRDLILSDGDIVDGVRVRPRRPILTPSGRLAFVSTLDNGDTAVFVDGKMVTRVGEGDVIDGVPLQSINESLLHDVNDAGTVLLWNWPGSWPAFAPGPNIFINDRVLLRPGDVVDGKRLTRASAGLAGPEDVLIVGEFEEDGVRKVAYFFNDQLVWDFTDDVEGLHFTGAGGSGTNHRGDVVFATRMEDGVGRIVTLRRLPADGDFDEDGIVGVDDIDALSLAVRQGDLEPQFDLNSDRRLTERDRQMWVEESAQTWFGDANLDGQFDSADLVQVFQAGLYEDQQPLNATWATGDWDGDGDFTTGDLVRAFKDGGYDRGPRTPFASVPEPTSATLVLLSWSVAQLHQRWTNKRRR